MSGCFGADDDSPREDPSVGANASPRSDRLAELGLVAEPPANVVRACRNLAREAGLSTVYCPPVVPEGPVQIQREGTETDYFLSFESESLVDPEMARDYDPDGPFTFYPGRPRRASSAWDPFAAMHWVVFSGTPARIARSAVDERLGFPGGNYETEARHFTVKGVRATVLTGDIAGPGAASRNHVIVYWRIGNVANVASVHFDDQAPVAEEIARGLIKQMVDCGPRSVDRDSRACDLVFQSS